MLVRSGPWGPGNFLAGDAPLPQRVLTLAPSTETRCANMTSEAQISPGTSDVEDLRTLGITMDQLESAIAALHNEDKTEMDNAQTRGQPFYYHRDAEKLGAVNTVLRLFKEASVCLVHERSCTDMADQAKGQDIELVRTETVFREDHKPLTKVEHHGVSYDLRQLHFEKATAGKRNAAGVEKGTFVYYTLKRKE